MRSKTCSAACAVRQYFMTFIHKSRFVEFIKSPPCRFDIIVVKSNIRMLEVDKISHTLGHLSPHSLVLKYRFPAFFAEFLYSVYFYIILVVQTELLFNFYFNRQTMRIPAGFTLNLVILHSFVTAYSILKCSRHNMMYTRPTVCRRRSFEENKRFTSLSVINSTLEDVYLVPIFCDRRFTFCNII